MSLYYNSFFIFFSLLIISSCSTNNFYGEEKHFQYNSEYNQLTKTITQKELIIRNGIFKREDGSCILQTEDFLGFNKIPIEDTYIETFEVNTYIKTINCPH